VEDCLVENLRIEGLLQTWGAVFKRVVLRGKIDRLMISTDVPVGMSRTESQVAALSEANTAYYATVDWALDISQAEFKECSLRGVPARLVRRDPETQVVVTREKALSGEHRKIQFPEDAAGLLMGIHLLLNRGDPDVVLVAAKRGRKFKAQLEGIELLRRAGIAKPD
jgi:hypothetical protein